MKLRYGRTFFGTAYLHSYATDLRSDLSIFQAASPGNRHSQKVQPLTGLPVIETAAADGESNRLPSKTGKSREEP